MLCEGIRKLAPPIENGNASRVQAYDALAGHQLAPPLATCTCWLPPPPPMPPPTPCAPSSSHAPSERPSTPTSPRTGLDQRPTPPRDSNPARSAYLADPERSSGHHMHLYRTRTTINHRVYSITPWRKYKEKRNIKGRNPPKKRIGVFVENPSSGTLAYLPTLYGYYKLASNQFYGYYKLASFLTSNCSEIKY